MDAINKTPAGPGAIPESEGLPLDEHVKAAWSLSGIDADDSFAVALSVLPASPKRAAPLKKASAPVQTDVAVQEVDADASIDLKIEKTSETKLKAETETETVKLETEAAPKAPSPTPALRTVRKKELRPDDSAAVITPQPTPIPVSMPDLAWQPQHGLVTNDQPRQQPPVSIPVTSAETVDAAPRREPAPILAALTPNTITPTGAKFMPATIGDLPRAENAAQRPAPIAPQASSPKQVNKSSNQAKPTEMPAPAKHADTATGQAHPVSNKAAPKPAHRVAATHVTVSEMQSVSPAAVLTTQAPDTPEAPLSVQAKLPAEAKEASEPMPIPMPAVASHKEKRAAKTAEPSQQSALPAQPLSPSAVTAGDEPVQPRQAKQQPRGASMGNAANAANTAAKTDKAANVNAGSGANASLTYRFDKWNGNHAVTVQTAMPADLPNTAAEQMPVQASSMPNATQYTLSPSDQLVGQRLQEHLAQSGRDANLPSVHLRDTDEHERQQQRQQHQQPQEDDEEEE